MALVHIPFLKNIDDIILTFVQILNRLLIMMYFFIPIFQGTEES